MNNDTLVDRQVLSFASVFDDSSVGACGSKIYFAAGHEFHHDRYKESERGRVFWYAGGIVDWNNLYASHRGVDEVDHGQYDKSIETPFITGCSLVVRREVVERVGMLDDKYFLYLEDLDWNIRIQKAGYKTIYFPKSIVWHVNAGSSGRPGNPMHEYYFTRNRLFLGMRYASLRTKFALIREGFRFFIGKSAIRRKAVLDWLFGRLGFQYEPKKYN
ncbi:MAG: Glycosyl transferase family 2 [Candidatus Levybacteria bacterium GW2011_GWC2_40_7]|nr:MAG: Glycosyl transferase family 2 [Candidatus Levybacteria bacterium GW2011_GWC2_40_7]